MDLIGVLIMLTFLALLATAAFAVPTLQPPAEKHTLRCPEDQRPASLLVSWNPTHQAVAIVRCDHARWQVHECHQECRSELARRFPTRVPTTVLA